MPALPPPSSSTRARQQQTIPGQHSPFLPATPCIPSVVSLRRTLLTTSSIRPPRTSSLPPRPLRPPRSLPLLNHGFLPLERLYRSGLYDQFRMHKSADTVVLHRAPLFLFSPVPHSPAHPGLPLTLPPHGFTLVRARTASTAHLISRINQHMRFLAAELPPNTVMPAAMVASFVFSPGQDNSIIGWRLHAKHLPDAVCTR
jgi:hypothetical protein